MANALTKVQTDGLKADAISGAKVADDAVNSEHYADGSIDTAHIADNQVTTGKIAADAVTGAKIADDAIDSEHYTDGSIDTAHIADSQVTTAKIAGDAITGAKIADDAVDSEHYTDGSIDTAHIADSQITSAKIADGTIVNADINASAAIAVSKISGAMPLSGGTFTGDVTFDNQSNAGKDITWDESADTLQLQDSVYIKLGGSGDLAIYHDGSDSYLAHESGTGDLILNTDSTCRIKGNGGGEYGLNVHTNGAVEAYYDNSKKFETTANGITVTGTVTATGGGLGGLFSSYAMVWDQKASDTGGGDFNNDAWRVRDLNSEEDPDGIVSLSSNKFTLGAGTYFIKWKAPAYDVQTHMSKLVDVTNSNNYVGTTELAWSADTVQSWSTGMKRVTIGGNTAFRIEHRCETTSGTNGYGIYLDWDSLVNMYTQVEIYKEA